MPSLSSIAVQLSDISLDCYAAGKGHTVYDVPLKENKSFSIEASDSTCHIFLADHLSHEDRKTSLAHELGHCEYAGFYNKKSRYELRSRIEYRADKWAFLRLAPPGAIKEAAKAGCSEAWEFAEWFGITNEYMGKILTYYSQQSLI